MLFFITVVMKNVDVKFARECGKPCFGIKRNYRLIEGVIIAVNCFGHVKISAFRRWMKDILL